MERCGVTFEAALEDAKRLGYAEADPTADISGADTARKICILADVAFGMYITHEDICYRGIESVVPADIKCASMLGYRIKLLGAARRCENGAEVFVEPMLVPAHSPLALVDNVYNAVSVEGNAVGDIMFSGRGAGAMPTASAVVADIIDAVTCSPKYPDFDPEGGKVVPAVWTDRFLFALKPATRADALPISSELRWLQMMTQLLLSYPTHLFWTVRG